MQAIRRPGEKKQRVVWMLWEEANSQVDDREHFLGVVLEFSVKGWVEGVSQVKNGGGGRVGGRGNGGQQDTCHQIKVIYFFKNLFFLTLVEPGLAWGLGWGQSTDRTGEEGHELCSAKECGFHPACSWGGWRVKEYKHHQSYGWWLEGVLEGNKREKWKPCAETHCHPREVLMTWTNAIPGGMVLRR